MLTIIVVILLIMCLGGFGYGYRGAPYGYPVGGLLGLVLIILLVLALLGHI